MGEHEMEMKNSIDEFLVGSDKLVYLLEGIHNRKFYTTKELCSLPPKEFVLFLTTGRIQGHRRYRPVKTPLNFDLMLESVKSKV